MLGETEGLFQKFPLYRPPVERQVALNLLIKKTPEEATGEEDGEENKKVGEIVATGLLITVTTNDTVKTLERRIKVIYT